MVKGDAPFIDQRVEKLLGVFFQPLTCEQLPYETSLAGIWFLQSSGDDGLGRMGKLRCMLVCIPADPKGMTGRMKRQGHLQTVQSVEIKANKQSTKPDLLCGFFSSGRVKSISSDLLLKLDTQLVTECLLCALHQRQTAAYSGLAAPPRTCGALHGVHQIPEAGALHGVHQTPEASVDVNGSPGQGGQEMLSRTAGNMLTSFVSIAQAFQAS